MVSNKKFSPYFYRFNLARWPNHGSPSQSPWQEKTIFYFIIGVKRNKMGSALTYIDVRLLGNSGCCPYWFHSLYILVSNALRFKPLLAARLRATPAVPRRTFKVIWTAPMYYSQDFTLLRILYSSRTVIKLKIYEWKLCKSIFKPYRIKLL